MSEADATNKLKEKSRIISVDSLTEDSRVTEFHKLFYHMAEWNLTWGASTYMGVNILKSPLDLQLYQELIFEVKPKLIIETGTAFGGSALYYAHLLDQLGVGKVISIDLQPVKAEYPRHPRISYFGNKSSTSSEILRDVNNLVTYYGGPVIVILDSDHSKLHVKAELNAYYNFVTPASYLVVEDTNINGHPVFDDFGPGPLEALNEWLPKHPDFKVDEAKSVKYLFTFHTWVRRRRV